VAWPESFGRIAVIGVESTGSYAAGLVRYLRSRASPSSRSTSRARTRVGRRGKSDPIDADMAARQALAGHASVIPKLTDGIVEAIRRLRLARDSAVKARTAAFNQLTEMIVTVPDDARTPHGPQDDARQDHAVLTPSEALGTGELADQFGRGQRPAARACALASERRVA
jgi:transposase